MSQWVGYVWSSVATYAVDDDVLCIQVPRQPACPFEAAPPISQLQSKKWPHGSCPLQRGDRHCRAHPARHHIYHPFCLHLLFHTWVQLPPRLLCHSSPSSVVFILILCSDSPNLCIVPVIHMHTYYFCTSVCVYVWFRAKVFPVWLRDNPLSGTLYTAIRKQSATLQYKHHFKEQTVTLALLSSVTFWTLWANL